MTHIAYTPSPPYYAVIFTSIRSGNDEANYQKMDEHMSRLVSKQAGFLGFESASDTIGVTVSYWSDIESIQKWKMNAEHQQAQALGKRHWYSHYKVRIAKVERDYSIG